MTNKTLIAALLATAGNKKLKVGARREAYSALETHFAESRLKMPAFIAELKSELERVRERGVCDLVRELLMDPDLSITDIVRACHRQFPGCQTSNKSVSSIKRDMVKEGVDVPTRAKRATPKITAAFADAIDALEDTDFESVDDGDGSDEE